MIYELEYNSPLGNIFIASDENYIIGLWFEGQKYFKDTVNEKIIKNNDLPVLKCAKKWLDRYFNGDKPLISELPIKFIGGKFRELVWNILCEIPYGRVTTYSEIAKKIEKIQNKKMSAQAVGGAVGHNPISIIVPCHRVIGKNGSLVGYAGGIDIKEKLLKHEETDMNNLYMLN